MRRLFYLSLMFVCASRSNGAEDPSFAKVRPILARCVACHNTDDASGDLDLTNRESALRGGESGPVIKPGQAEASKLFKLVASRRMPPKKPLAADDVALLREWIQAGAHWEGTLSAATEQDDADSPRWAFRPIVAHEIPDVKNRAWVRDPIDAFILQGLETKGLAPNPPADRATWLRRVSFDLTGLPPTPEEITAFLNDQADGAHERVVDRLLDSPRYGERWARHWLDLARFAESHGFEYDRIRDHAWRYRDYVVKSFNTDKPYAQFIREQVAGDVLKPVTADGIIATGFLVAGPWDQAGSGQANLIGRGRIREEELEDVVGVVAQTFLGLTVQCARCHSHKFDPIPQRDYYRLKAAFEGVGHGDRPALGESEQKAREARRKAIAADLSRVEADVNKLEREARQAVLAKQAQPTSTARPEPMALWTFENDARDDLGRMHGNLKGDARINQGRLILSGKGAYLESEPLPHDLGEKTLEAWVVLADKDQRGGGLISVESDARRTFDAIVFGEREPGKWIAGSEFYNRTRDLAAPREDAPAGTLIHTAIAYDKDGSIRVYRNGVPYGEPYRPAGPNGDLQDFRELEKQRFSHVLIGQRHRGAENGYLRGEVEEARLYRRALTPGEVAASFRAGPERISAEELDRALDEATRRRRQTLVADLARLRAAQAELAADPLVYAALPFNPPVTRLLNRGDFETPAEEVAVGGLSAIRAPSADFGLKPTSPEAERRRKLADWLADSDNPLPARVLVNRLWHYHFGTGIVATPSDFGANGARPSHPALLDRLASDFLASGGKVKAMQRRIVLSNTYLQSSKLNPRAAAVDAEARLLWRFPPRRLEGEAVLDAMLAASGRLQPIVGGPSFRPFTVTFFNSSFYNLTDPDEPEYRRRTLYRMHVHSARSPLMEGLDCPDPSVKTARRTPTVTPLQALALMNDSFVERQARKLADRVKADVGGDRNKQVERAYFLTLGRPPREDESKAAQALIADHPLDRLTWALVNANEFLYLR